MNGIICSAIAILGLAADFIKKESIPSIAKTLAKGMTQVRQATNDIKSEIQKSVDTDIDNNTKNLSQDFQHEVDKVKKDFKDLGDSIKREL